MPHGAALIVEDDPTSVRVIRRVLPGDLVCRVAATAARAISMLRAHTDTQLVLIDVNLAEQSSGFDVLAVVIAEYPWVARALVTGDDSANTNNRARALSTDLIRKPFDGAALAPTLARMVTLRASSSAGNIDEYVTMLAARVGLSDRELEVLARLVANEARSELPGAMAVAKSTVDTFIRGIVAKTGARDVREVVESVLRRTPLLGKTERRLR